MIHIIDKHNCCGCSTCVQKCPKQCISMLEDEEGFLYPQVKVESCINCQICEKVCPCLNQGDTKDPLVCYAIKNKDEEIRKLSSSGGFFSAVAEKMITEGGVVFGARFDDDWQVIHDYTDSLEELIAYRGSKYVQSKINDCFKQVENFLKEGRKVLFSGTPCQISGLNRYINQDYDNLLKIEVACHGVPSPKIWREYLDSLKITNIGSISHKNKIRGWRDYSFSIQNKEGKSILCERSCDNKYMMAFVRNLTIRPSCFLCPAKAGKSGADITMADYWGIENIIPRMDDDKGTSFICVNTEKGNSIVEKLNLQIEKTDYGMSIVYNPCIFKSTEEPFERQRFWDDYMKHGIKTLLSLKKPRKNILERAINRLLLK